MQGIFSTGKYAGKSHKFVAGIDPEYIITAYETRLDSVGISNEIYRLAQLIIDQDQENSINEEQHQWDNVDEVDRYELRYEDY